MERRAFLKSALVGSGSLLIPSVARADHIQEATIPIERVDLWVGHYATGTRLDNDILDTWPNQFARLRSNVYIFADRSNGAPTEHFDVTQTINYPWVENKHANLYIFDHWRHQNTPPHSALRWQIDNTQIGSVRNKPGLWRISYLIEGRESGRIFEPECIFEVIPEG